MPAPDPSAEPAAGEAAPVTDCVPTPDVALRPMSPSSWAFLRNGRLSLCDGHLTIAGACRVVSVPVADVAPVVHRYRLVSYGHGASTVIAGELVFHRHDGTRIASLPGGWVGNPLVLADGRSIALPGWWNYAQVSGLLGQAGLALREVGVDDAASAFALLNSLYCNRPLAPLSFHPLQAVTGWVVPARRGGRQRPLHPPHVSRRRRCCRRAARQVSKWPAR